MSHHFTHCLPIAHASWAAYAILELTEQNRPIPIPSEYAGSVQCDCRGYQGLNLVGLTSGCNISFHWFHALIVPPPTVTMDNTFDYGHLSVLSRCTGEFWGS